jgi:hypothetical protein
MAKRDRVLCQLKVTLRDINPPIWRRIQVWEDTTLGQLRQILQIVMGWEDCHQNGHQQPTEIRLRSPDRCADSTQPCRKNTNFALRSRFSNAVRMFPLNCIDDVAASTALVATPILRVLDHEYRLEKIAA